VRGPRKVPGPLGKGLRQGDHAGAERARRPVSPSDDRARVPFCPRSEDDPLIQYARQSWFVRTSQFKEEFLKNNDAVNWLPEHIQEGRFGDFLRNNVDWALSRERYWGTPLPIWVCEKTGKMEAIGSYAELLAKPGATDGGVWEQAKREDPTIPDHLRVHKPYIDAWTYDSPFAEGNEGSRDRGIKGKARMRRVPEVIDCWWDAGSMPFAQWGFPHADNSVQTFSQRFPADFISEAIDQTRGWFYGCCDQHVAIQQASWRAISPAPRADDP
jgi:isoleucyl-tRNA synthetase